MAENKKSFVLYCDLIHTIEKMPDDKAGLVFKHLLKYVNDQNPVTDDLIVDVVFEPIKHQLKRDLKKYEVKKDQWSEAGKKSAEKRALSKINEAQRNPTNVETVATESTVNVNVNDTVNVTVNDNVIFKKEIKLNLIDKYFKDFENGSEIVRMAQFQKTTVEVLKAYIPQFRLKANSEYQSYGKFVDHFRNTFLKNPPTNNEPKFVC